MAEPGVLRLRILGSGETPGACSYFSTGLGAGAQVSPPPRPPGGGWQWSEGLWANGVLAPWYLIVCCWGRACDHPEAGPLFRYLRAKGL